MKPPAQNPPELVAQGKPPSPQTSESQPQPTVMVSASVAQVVRAAILVLQQKGVPIALADPDRGLVSSGSVPLREDALKQVVQPQFLLDVPADAEGRYLVSFRAEKLGDNQSRVVVGIRVILGNALADSPIGGMVVPSNGTLEKQYIQLLTEAVQRLR